MHTESENGRPMFTFTRFVDLLLKGQGHKYIKRIPYNTPKGRRYRYIYDVTHTHRGTKAIDESHLVVGTAFMLNNEAGQVKHGHITHIDGDRVTFIIDDGPKKGKKVTTTKAKVIRHLNKTHGVETQVAEKRAKINAQITQARKTGTEKQVARLEERLRRLGGQYTPPSEDFALKTKEHIRNMVDEINERVESRSYAKRGLIDKIYTENTIELNTRRTYLRDLGFSDSEIDSLYRRYDYDQDAQQSLHTKHLTALQTAYDESATDESGTEYDTSDNSLIVKEVQNYLTAFLENLVRINSDQYSLRSTTQRLLEICYELKNLDISQVTPKRKDETFKLRLKNQAKKRNEYKGNYDKVFKILERDSLGFTQTYWEESYETDGDDMILELNANPDWHELEEILKLKGVELHEDSN